MEHFEVYREPGRFAGWPANYGMWAWGDEIVVGFTVGHCGGGADQFHTRDMAKPFTTMQARSLDGGRTWHVTPHPARAPGNCALSADEHVEPHHRLEHAMQQADCLNMPQPHPGGIDFAAPNFAMMCARTGLVRGVTSFFYTSADRCHTWDGPFALPMFDLTGVAARTDCVVLGKHDCLLMLTGNKPDGREGRVFCARTTDGGASFQFVSHVGPEIIGDGWSIMPASLALPDGSVITALRCGEPTDGIAPWKHWIDLYTSNDQGNTWTHLCRPEPHAGINGNPPTLNQLPDGRLCLIYGYRDKPHGLRARLSSDSGRTWSDAIHLRDDGGAPDLGYPRAVVLADGTVVTAYYFTDTPHGERYIAATRWKL